MSKPQIPMSENMISCYFQKDKNSDTKKNARTVSFFEFWPAWIMYFPVALQWLLLAVRYRSFMVPFLANPSLTLSGMVGVTKSELMQEAKGVCAETILPWVSITVDNRAHTEQAKESIQRVKDNNIFLPFVCKPEIGCRGVGLKLIENQEQLVQMINSYPPGASFLCQKLASYEPEVGIFYVKDPKTGESQIASLTYKFLPKVIGDGTSTLGQLIARDPRAGKLQHLYYERHKNAWNTIPEKDESIQLVFSASHSKGAIFFNAEEYITPALTKSVEEIMQGLPDFYYGRLDAKFADIESLKQGKTLQIVEINGASAETIHIWNSDTKFLDAIRALLWQYRTLFRIGAYHRSQGKTPPSLGTLLRHWKIERNLTKHYPLTD